MVLNLCLGDVKTEYGNTCIFPFKYQNVQYNECLKAGAQRWCGYEVELTMAGTTKTHYDKCAFDC